MAIRCTCITCEYCISLKIRIFVLFVMCLYGQFAGSEDDPYLSAISSEAEKVDSTQLTSGDGDEPETIDRPDLRAFEDDLKASYMGSFTFYRRLPRRSREEVFEEYRGGASIDEIRNMIMDRFLSR